MKKVIIYSHDTYGLGNIRRMLTIAKSLVDSDPDMSVLILSGSPMLHAFRISSRIDYVKLPCLKRSTKGDYTVKHLGLALNSTIQLRSSIIVSAIAHFEPDVIIVDKKPLGVCDELSPALNFVCRSGMNTKLVLLLRDIIDSSNATTRIWDKNKYYALIEKFYDSIMVVGSREIFDLGTEYRFPSSCLEKLNYCGYLRREKGIKGKEAIQQELGINKEKFVLVTPGGGEDGFNLILSYLQGLRDSNREPDFKSLIIHGPEMSKENQKEIRELASQLPSVVLKEYTDDMLAYMGAADLVVSMGGYNTICEILSLKKRAIVIPRVTPVVEQWIRARRMARRGLFRFIHPEYVSAKSIMAMVVEELAKSSTLNESHNQVDMEGLPHIANSILSMIGKKRELDKNLCFKVIRNKKLLEYKKISARELRLDGLTGSQLSNS